MASGYRAETGGCGNEAPGFDEAHRAVIIVHGECPSDARSIDRAKTGFQIGVAAHIGDINFAIAIRNGKGACNIANRNFAERMVVGEMAARPGKVDCAVAAEIGAPAPTCGALILAERLCTSSVPLTFE